MEESTRATLADLLTYKESPLLIKESKVAKPVEPSMNIPDSYLLFFYGSYRRVHGAASGAIVIYDPMGRLVEKKGLQLFASSNNEAEYAALEIGLQVCLKLGIQ